MHDQRPSPSSSSSAPTQAAGRGATPRRRWLRRVAIALGLVVGLVILIGAIALVWFRVQLTRSLPQLQGTIVVAGLAEPVRVDRDELGIPTITGASRLDVALATGFVHAQDRFFQMDLARRRAAGELSELFGAATFEVDRATRVHAFRHRAGRVLEAADDGDRALLEAYAEGVNAGLSSLRAAPFEYLMLRVEPRPWTPEDSVLVLASMFFQLQDHQGLREHRAGALLDAVPGAIADFLTAPSPDWETPLVGEVASPPLVPGPEILDVRASVAPARAAGGVSPSRDPAPSALDVWLGRAPDDVRGSNNWAVGARHTAHGGGLVAGDMHLGLSVPNIWYRATFSWSEGVETRTASGITLPGIPIMVVGSNGDVAWAFTNSTGDWSDLVVIEPEPHDDTQYRTPDGPRRFEVRREGVRVKGEADREVEVRDTIWGPVVATDHRQRPLALRWVPHDVEGLNLRISGPERASTLAEALDAARAAGIPAQNFVIADRFGNVAWTIAGRIPRRVGFRGVVPTSWADGTRGWDGWLERGEYPRVVNPPSGRIWTANNRLVDGEMLAALGDGGYDQGARARQIRDALLETTVATPADMLRIQLDDRALFLERWRQLAVETLRSAPRDEDLEACRQLLEEEWPGRAATDSVAYRLVRSFRSKAAELAFAPLVAQVRAVDAAFPATLGRAYEGPLWALVEERPHHLLDPRYASWDELLVDALRQTLAALEERGRWRARTWGEVNTARIQHPLGRAVPLLSRWLDMPAEPLPGDAHMPRVQGADFGASQRFGVAPGREHEGYFHMPGGQSGHPLSPHYRDMHRAWVEGTPTPFLPGPPVHGLTLTPGPPRAVR
jgi:penicillin G amidase